MIGFQNLFLSNNAAQNLASVTALGNSTLDDIIIGNPAGVHVRLSRTSFGRLRIQDGATVLQQIEDGKVHVRSRNGSNGGRIVVDNSNTVLEFFRATKSIQIKFNDITGSGLVINVPDADGVQNMALQSWVTEQMNTAGIGFFENRAKIVAQTTCTAKNFHGTCNKGEEIFAGTRADGITPSVLVHFKDRNDLTDFDEIEMPLGIAGINGIESACYNELLDKVFCPLSGTNKILEADASNILDYTIHTISGLPSGASFALATVILTDGNYLYIGTEQSPARFIKIDASTMAVVASNTWTGSGKIHAGEIEVDQNKAYYTTNGANDKLAIVNLTDLTYTEVNLGISGLTDDFALVKLNDTGSNYIITVAESRTGAQKGGVLVDLLPATPVVYPFDMLPGFSVRFDPIYMMVYCCSLDGYIEVWTLQQAIESAQEIIEAKTASTVYSIRGYMPNELFFFDNGSGNDLYSTFWQNPIGGSLAKIELQEVTNPLMSEMMLKYRF